MCFSGGILLLFSLTFQRHHFKSRFFEFFWLLFVTTHDNNPHIFVWTHISSPIREQKTELCQLLQYSELFRFCRFDCIESKAETIHSYSFIRSHWIGKIILFRVLFTSNCHCGLRYCFIYIIFARIIFYYKKELKNTDSLSYICTFKVIKTQRTNV